MRRLYLALPAALLLALVSAAAAAADTGLSPVHPESPNATAIRQTYWIILAVTGVIFVLVEGALVLFVFRFRSRGRARGQEAAQIHGATRIQTASAIVPVLILAGIVAFVFVKLPSIKNVPRATAGNPPLRIRVEGHQFYWQYVYPGGQVSVKTMVVPVGKVVTLDVISPDVIHSFWVPALGDKVDAVPGRTNHGWFEAEKVGSYAVHCAALCGLEHAHMTGSVDVVTDAQYQSFLAAHVGASKALGQEIFQGACATCHGFSGQGDYGPSLVNNATVASTTNLEQLLRNGKNKMPAVGATWTNEEMTAAVTYLKARFASGS